MLIKTLPVYFEDFSTTTNEDVHRHYTRNRSNLHNYYVKHEFAKKCLRYNIIPTINKCPKQIKEKVNTHSIQGFAKYTKNFFIEKYKTSCTLDNCYVCQNQ